MVRTRSPQVFQCLTPDMLFNGCSIKQAHRAADFLSQYGYRVLVAEEAPEVGSAHYVRPLCLSPELWELATEAAMEGHTGHSNPLLMFPQREAV